MPTQAQNADSAFDPSPARSAASRVRAAVPKWPREVTPQQVHDLMPEVPYQTVASALNRAALKPTSPIRLTERGAYTLADRPGIGWGDDEIVTDDTDTDDADGSPGPFVTYPVAANGHGAAETGRVNDPDRGHLVRFPEALIRRWTGGDVPRRAFWTYAAGTSAEPHIPNGSPVFVEECAGEELVDGERYAVWLGEADADVIKRITVGAGGTVTLRSDNRLVPPRTLYPTDDPTLWYDGAPRNGSSSTVRFVVRGRVIIPSDAPAATTAYLVGEIAGVAAAIASAVR